MTTDGPTPHETCQGATDTDLDALARLVAESIGELRAGRGGEVWARSQARRPPYAEGLAAELADPSHQVVVGRLDDAVVGYGVARLQHLADGGVLGVVTDLYTEPEGREVGLGELMMNALIDWCRQQGCFGVDSLALPGDRHTKNFFESFGLVARAITVHKPLS